VCVCVCVRVRAVKTVNGATACTMRKMNKRKKMYWQPNANSCADRTPCAVCLRVGVRVCHRRRVRRSEITDAVSRADEVLFRAGLVSCRCAQVLGSRCVTRCRSSIMNERHHYTNNNNDIILLLIIIIIIIRVYESYRVAAATTVERYEY